MKRTLVEIADSVRAEPQLVVADDWEVSVRRETSVFTHFSSAQKTKVALVERTRLGLRVFHRKRMGVAWSNSLGRSPCSELVQAAFESAEASDVDLWSRFPIWRQVAETAGESAAAKERDVSLFCDAVVPLEDLGEVAESRAAYDLIVRKREKQALYFSTQSETTALDTPVLCERWALDGAYAARPAVQKSQLTRAQRFLDESQWLSSAEPREIEPGLPIVLSSRVVAAILERVGEWFSAETVFAGDSPLSAQVEGVGFSNALSLLDSASYPGSGHSRPWDAEGVPAQDTWLIEGGSPRGLLLNTYYAARENRLSTGSLRFDWKSGRLRIAPSTLVIAPGSGGPATWLKHEDKSVYLYHLEALHGEGVTCRAVLAGAHIQNGEWVGSARQVAVPVLEIFKQMRAVGADLQLYEGVAAPSIFLSQMPLSE